MDDVRATPLPPPDPERLRAFWARARRAMGLSDDATYVDACPFGDHVELADELVELVLHGPKRATATSLAELVASGLPVPAVGDLWVACDGRQVPRAVLDTTDVRIGPLSSVDDEFGWGEGEGDRSRAFWLRVHSEYFTRAYAALGQPFHPDIQVAFERFAVRYTEP